jgi:hypothetical protein
VNAPKILVSGETYTFSKYFELNASPRDILADLGYAYDRSTLTLPRYPSPLAWSEHLSNTIHRNLRRVNPTTEQSRRETLIAPVLLEVCDFLDLQLEIEYPITVNNWLKGSLDYFIPHSTTSANPLLIIEAKQADLTRGFVQLAVELIAIAQWSNLEQIIYYGAVTTGEIWKFGTLQPLQRSSTEDLTLYRNPQDLDELLPILVGILSGF